MRDYKRLFVILLSVLFICPLFAQINEMVIKTNKPGAEIQSTMYGLFFEDINYAADGGLYAELVKNRSFEFPDRFMGWKPFGRISVRNDGPFEKNPHYVRLAMRVILINIRDWITKDISELASNRVKNTVFRSGRERWIMRKMQKSG